MNACTFKAESLQEIDAQIRSCIDNNFSPTLAIIFCSVSQDLEGVSLLMDTYGIDIYGATTAGEIIDDEVLEFSTVCMLLDIDRDYYRLFFAETGEKSTAGICREMGVYGQAQFDSPGFMVTASGLETDGEAIIQGMMQEFGENVSLYGGLAGDDFNMEDSFVFTNNRCTNNGIVGLVLNQERITIEGIATSGWQPVGVEKTITRSVGNVVYTIDDEPALDVFIKYFGLSSEMDARKEVINTLGVQFPLHIIRGEDQSVIRAPLMGNSDDGSLIFAGGVPQGAKVKFSVPPGFDIVEKVIQETQQLKDFVPESDALILFSCKARHMALGSMVEAEIAGMRKYWDAPMVGFFTYGEIGRQPAHACEFHNETCSLVVLKEIRN